MSFKTQWIDKQDNVDDVRASDINSIAQELIRVNDEKIDGSYVDGQISEVTQKIKESYPYNLVNMSSVAQRVDIYQNAVTYVYGGPTKIGRIYLQILTSAGTDVSKEAVMILDLSSYTTNPMVQFEASLIGASIKWLNGEPPTIEAGKIYMFSFILTKDENNAALFYLGIGGEFA